MNKTELEYECPECNKWHDLTAFYGFCGAVCLSSNLATAARDTH